MVNNSKLYFTSIKQLAETIKRFRSKPILTRRLGFSVLIQNNIRSTRSGIVSLFLTPNPTEWLALLSHFILVMYYLSVYYTRVFLYLLEESVPCPYEMCWGSIQGDRDPSQMISLVIYTPRFHGSNLSSGTLDS